MRGRGICQGLDDGIGSCALGIREIHYMERIDVLVRVNVIISVVGLAIHCPATPSPAFLHRFIHCLPRHYLEMCEQRYRPSIA
jgi:hypothetical protein